MAWTKDGRHILFAQQGEHSSIWQIMRVPATGGQAEFTGISANLLADFELSPDGSKIVYSGRTTNEEMWALDNVLAALK
jgi:Tol biopolymer transport system component